MTPAEIRDLATAHYGWQPGDALTKVAISSLSSRSGVTPAKVRRALESTGRRGKKVPSSPLKTISIRLREDREPIALRLAHQAGHRTVSAWVQGLVEMEIREAGEGEKVQRLLDQPPAPTPALVEAFRKHGKATKGG